MKLKINNIFNNNNTKEVSNKNINKIENVKKEEKTELKRRRKGAYKKEEKNSININLKNYFDNLFRNKNNLSKGYYILLIAMLLLGCASVAMTFKSYKLFAKEEYEIYANDSKDEDKTVSTISSNDNTQQNTFNDEKNTTNPAEAKVNKITTTNKNQSTVKPLSFSKPLNGDIQKPYSIDKVIYSKTLELWKTHDGIDISAEVGTNVKSIEKGTVEKVYDDSFYGITVVIDHGQGYKSSYSNLDKNTYVKEKQSVKKGQVIGKISNTSIGEIKDDSHLHFILFKDNINVDPTYIFK